MKKTSFYLSSVLILGLAFPSLYSCKKLSTSKEANIQNQAKNLASKPLTSLNVATLPTSLKAAFNNIFFIGAALSTEEINETNPAVNTLILKHFNTVTPENDMKSMYLQPSWNTFDFTTADKLVAYAQKNNLMLNGHTLVWHAQLPSFVEKIKSADSVRQFMVNHINTVAGRYVGKVYSWDVVNEALNDDGTMRNSIFLQKLGPNYVVDAFRLTQQVSPNTKLFYNDYYIEKPAKRAGAIALIKKIQAAGVRIDGVGIQGHWTSGQVPFTDIENSIKEYSALGIKVCITELDLDVVPSGNPYAGGLPAAVQERQSQDYENLFRLFLKYKDNIERITFWGVHDGQSWLNYFPYSRTNYPLLFDRNFNPKSSYDRVIATPSNVLLSGSVYQLISAVNNSSVLDVSGVQTANGTLVQIWENLGANNQKWKITDVGNGYYKIQPLHALTKALDVSAVSTANGAPLQIWEYGGGNNQKWRITNAGGGYYSLAPAHALGSRLDVSNGNSINGTKVQIWSSNGASNQQWKFVMQ